MGVKMTVLIASVYILLFILSLSLSPIIYYMNVPGTLNTPLIALALAIISFGLVKHFQVSVKLRFLLALMILSLISRMVSLYLLVPIGFSSDQRTFYINIIVEYGDIYHLEAFTETGLNYILYPVMWLVAAQLCLVSHIDGKLSQLITVLATYLVFLTLLYVILIKMYKHNNKCYTLAWMIIALLSVVYIHRPFQDLIASSMGILAMIFSFYLWSLNDRKALLVNLLILSLYMAHALAIYMAIAMFLVIALVNYVFRDMTKTKLALYFAFSIFSGTWVYQVATLVLDSLVRQIPYRLDQLLTSLLSPLERPESSEAIAEQELHFTSPTDIVSTLLAYMLPPVILTAISLSLLYELYKRRSYINTLLFSLSLLSLVMYYIAGIFAWKGIENAIARYLYVYASSLYVLIVPKYFVYRDRETKPMVLVVLLLSLVISIAITETFFTPYASITSIPDISRFKTYWTSYVAPSSINLNMLDMFPLFLMEARNKGCFILMQPSEALSAVTYTNGIITIQCYVD